MTQVQIKRLHSMTGHRDGIFTLQSAGSDPYFFSGAGDGMVVRWNLAEPDAGELVAKLPNSIYALYYSVKENLLIAGHNYDGIHLLDWQNKTELASLQLTKAAIFDIQSLRENLYVATGDGTIVAIDLKTLAITKKVQA